jgi:hypothetical protein
LQAIATTPMMAPSTTPVSETNRARAGRTGTPDR